VRADVSKAATGTELLMCARTSVTMPSPSRVYGAPRLAQPHVLSSWAAAFGGRLTILRLQNIHGPGQSLTDSDTAIVSLFWRIACTGNSIPLYENGAMLHDFVSIDDMAAAWPRGVRSAGAAEQPVDIGTGKASAIAAWAHQIAARYGTPAPHVCGNYRFGDVRHVACVADDAAVASGWTARVDTADGLKAPAAWIETQLPPPKDSDAN
jgi:dTDP-L-rhamnose 4-epimerase